MQIIIIYKIQKSIIQTIQINTQAIIASKIPLITV